MSEIAALRATDRARPMPQALRTRAYALVMDLPEEVEEIPAAQEPRPLPARVTRESFATLMGATEQAPRRMRRPMIMRLLAASLAVALPAAALIVSASLKDTTSPERQDNAPVAQGPVYEDRLDRAPRVLGLKIERPPTASEPGTVKAPGKQTTRRAIRRTTTTTTPPRQPGRTGRPGRGPVVDTPATTTPGVLDAVLAQVTQATEVVCSVTGNATVVVQLCAAK